MSTFKPATEWIAPDVFPTELLINAKQIAIDTETRDPNLTSIGPGYIRGDGEVVGISVACDGFEGYFPFGHETGFNFPKNKVVDIAHSFLSLCLINSSFFLYILA